MPKPPSWSARSKNGRQFPPARWQRVRGIIAFGDHHPAGLALEPAGPAEKGEQIMFAKARGRKVVVRHLSSGAMFERLEPRTLLSGTVTVALVGGSLTLTGTRSTTASR